MKKFLKKEVTIFLPDSPFADQEFKYPLTADNLNEMF
jgi:hypothetical protein